MCEYAKVQVGKDQEKAQSAFLRASGPNWFNISVRTPAQLTEFTQFLCFPSSNANTFVAILSPALATLKKKPNSRMRRYTRNIIHIFYFNCNHICFKALKIDIYHGTGQPYEIKKLCSAKPVFRVFDRVQRATQTGLHK